MQPFIIIGAGFSGAVLARELASASDSRVLVLDERDHVGGHCHTARDPNTGILLHKFGPHIFHTDRETVWRYLNRFCEFGLFINRVKAMTSRGVFSFPINLHTINQFFGKTLSPGEAREFLRSRRDTTIRDAANFEEQALKLIGRELYEVFFRGYTEKQWGCHPRQLPASLLKRLPVRFDYNDNYYSSRYQGIPLCGYTEVISRILNHPNIEVKLNTTFSPEMVKEAKHLFYTGPIDRYFQYCYGPLGYRTVFWEKIEGVGDYQGAAVINYPEATVPFTRIHEHKHFAPWEAHQQTLAFREFSKATAEGDVPYYPKRLSTDNQLLVKYRTLADNEEKVSFLGRLGTYRYLDMDQVIGEALEFSASFMSWISNSQPTRPRLL